MCRIVFSILTLGVGLLATGCTSSGPKHLAYWSSVQSQEGWSGRRYSENGVLVAEEFDVVGGDGRIDLWRFYEKGVRLLEEADRDGDKRVDFRANYDSDTGAPVYIERDTDFNGTMNLTVAHTGGSHWEQLWDRNGDDTVDYRFEWRGSQAMLKGMDLDLYEIVDFSAVILRTDWVFVMVDRDFDGQFDVSMRFHEGKASEQNAVSAPSSSHKEYTAITHIRPASAETSERKKRLLAEKESVSAPTLPDENISDVQDVNQSFAEEEDQEEAPETHARARVIQSKVGKTNE